MKDTKTNSERKKKSAVKKKTSTIPHKRVKRTVKKKTKSVIGKKAKKPAGAKTKSSTKRNVRKTTTGKLKRVVRKKTTNPFKAKAKSPVKTPLVEEKITHGEDLHLIPVEGEIHPIGPDEANRLENIFQNREEVTLQQENQKVKDALGSPKNLKKNFRITGHRH